MATEKNKVKFGLRNVHIAPITGFDEITGKPTYGDFKAFPGAVNLTLAPRGEMSEFYADDRVYYARENNQGYDGTFESALIHDWFSQDIMGEQVVDGVLVESTQDKSKDFAMAFEFQGDQKQIRHVLYRCSASRADINGATNTASGEPQTSTLNFVSSAREGDLLVKARTTSDTTDEVYKNWYEAPYEPNIDTEITPGE